LARLRKELFSSKLSEAESSKVPLKVVAVGVGYEMR
jgi:hypothetical protein